MTIQSLLQSRGLFVMLLVSILAGGIFAPAEAQIQAWVARYNGPGNSQDVANDLVVDKVGNVYVTGYSFSAATKNDYATIKYNSAGVQQWVALYNGPGNDNDNAVAVAVDNAGNVYVTGSSIGAGTSADYATIKYNSAGVQQWVVRFNGPGNAGDGASAMEIDNAGNIYVTGSSGGSGTGGDYTTIKYNSAGVQQWVERYNGPGNGSDGTSAIAIDGTGNVYVTGISDGVDTGPDYATIKYNASGAQQWVARYNSAGNTSDRAVDIALDQAGNIYVTGSAGTSTAMDYVTVKYNAAGAQQWVARYNGPANTGDNAVGMAVDTDGNVYVTGTSVFVGFKTDYATIKYNSAGVQQWVAPYDGVGHEYDSATAITTDGAGNIYVTGSSEVAHDAFDDYATVKYNAAGVQQWAVRYGREGFFSDDKAKAVAVDDSGNVYVTGNSGDPGGPSDYATIKYKQSEIKPEAAITQPIGAEFFVDVVVSSVRILFGVSFELTYNTTSVDALAAEAGSFLGSDVLFFPQLDDAAGKVSIGITRKQGQGGVSGSGVVTRIKFKSLATTPPGTQVVFALRNVTANDPDGKAISLVASATITVTITGVIVWPGDTNNDRLVNQVDVLPLGLHWSRTGPARQNASTSWIGQVALPWSPEAATHADANGDGVVNQADVLPIGLNWQKTHTAPSLVVERDHSFVLNKTNAANLSTAITGDTNPGQDFWIEVRADQVTNFFGVAFELLYSPTTLVDPQATEAGSFMGNDVIFFPNTDKNSGKISIGITRKSGQGGVEGSGVVARIMMRVSTQAVRGQVITLILQNALANDPAGQPIQLSVTGQTNVVVSVVSRQHESLPEAFALHANVPNPFNPSTTIKYDLAEATEVRVEIFDLLGKHVRTLVNQRQAAGRYAVSWDGRNENGQVVTSGVFIYQLRAGHFAQSRKMMLVR
jgi:uncharacterized delta-60 repeat protein